MKMKEFSQRFFIEFFIKRVNARSIRKLLISNYAKVYKMFLLTILIYRREIKSFMKELRKNLNPINPRSRHLPRFSFKNYFCQQTQKGNFLHDKKLFTLQICFSLINLLPHRPFYLLFSLFLFYNIHDT